MLKIKKTIIVIAVVFGLLFLTSCTEEKTIVRFYYGYDNKIQTVEIPINTKVEEPVNPERTGYTFGGWYLLEAPYGFNKEVKENITLTAKWDILTYEVTFDLEDVKDQTVTYLNKVEKPVNPERVGYTFIGWYNGDNLYDFNKEVKENITLTAKWDILTYKVTFDLEDVKDQTVTHLNKAEKPANPERVGYTFIGWYNGDNLYDFNKEVKENITLTAKWDILTYKVTFDLEDVADQAVTHLNKVEKPVNPERVGYTFIGWYNGDNLYNFNEEIKANLNLTAKWEILTYKVTFDLEDVADQAVTYLNKVEKPVNPERTGYTFIGWYLEDILYDFTFGVTKDLALISKWEKIETKIFISEFKDLNDNEVKIISGIITSFGLYDYLTIADETDSVIVNVTGYKVNDLINLGYKIGNRLTLKAKKTSVGNLLIALTDLSLINKEEVINDLPNSVNVSNLTMDGLVSYNLKLVTFNNLVITNIKDENNSLVITLKNDNLTLNLVYDTRYIFKDYDLIHSFKTSDIIKIEKSLLVFNSSPELRFDEYTTITKIGGVIVNPDETLFKIFYLNDTHGAVLENGNELGLAKIGNYIKKEKDENSMIIAGGDMFQGQLISNANDGALMVEVLNNLNFDAFVIGNHEFDWGLEVVLKYFDPNTTGIKANFPLLGANVRRVSDDEIPEFIDRYTIVNKGSYKIGIVGVIGDGLESSIAKLRVQDYYFSDAYTAVKDTITEIEDLVDFVLVVNHASDSSFNKKVSKLPKVKAIFNGHTHSAEQDHLNNVPYIQSAANGTRVGRVELLINKENGLTLKNSNVENVSYHEHLNSKDIEIESIISSYYEEIKHLYEEEIIKASRDLSKNNLAYFIAELMAKSTNSVFGLQNSGGTRSTINKGSITGSDVFKVFPFDNLIVSVLVTGKDLKKLYNRETYKYLDIDYSSINDSSYYQIATNDYVFYNDYNSDVFKSVYDEVSVHFDLYQTFYNYLVNLKNSGQTYFDTNDIVVYQNSIIFIYAYYENKNSVLKFNNA